MGHFDKDNQSGCLFQTVSYATAYVEEEELQNNSGAVTKIQ